MSLEKIGIIFICTFVTLAFAIIHFRKTLYAWILTAGIVGIPVFVVRDSVLLISEVLIIPLLLLWFMEKKFKVGIIRLSGFSTHDTKIERSMWVMIVAFTISSIYNIMFPDTSVRWEHTSVVAKLVALFLYIAPVMVALLIKDSISTFDNVRTMCFLLFALGLVVFIITFDFQHAGLTKIQRTYLRAYHVGGFYGGAWHWGILWSWMSITILLAFSFAYVLFHPKLSTKVKNSVLAFLCVYPVVDAYLHGTASYKALILAYFLLILTILYFRSKRLAYITLCVSIALFIATIAVFYHYVEQETQQGSWGDHGRSRTAVWTHSLYMFAQRPILGVGPYNYYDYSKHIAEQKREGDTWGVMTSPHGQYVQLLVETGLLGFLACMWFLVEVCRLLLFYLKLDSDYEIKIVASALAGIMVSRLAVSVVGDYLISHYHNAGLNSFSSTIYFWVCLGILMGLRNVLTAEA